MGKVHSHCLLGDLNHLCANPPILISLYYIPCSFCCRLSLSDFCSLDRKPLEHQTTRVLYQTGLWDALHWAGLSTSPLATRPSRPKPGKPRALGQVAARTEEGLAHPSAHLLPLHHPRLPPLSPPCRPAPLPPPPKRRRHLPPHHHAAAAAAAVQAQRGESQAAGTCSVAVRGRGSGGGVLKGGTPPLLRCPTEAAVFHACSSEEGLQPGVDPGSLGRCPLY